MEVRGCPIAHIIHYPHHFPTTATVSINMGERTFDTLQTAGRLFPVPSVAVAANVALSIVQEAQVRRATLFHPA